MNRMDPRNAGIEDLLCDESFQRYCRGEDHADILLWETWIRENPDKLGVVAEAKRLYDVLNLGQGNRAEQLAALKDAMARQLQFKEEVLRIPETMHTTPARVIPFHRRSWVKYAAGIVVLITVGVIAYTKYGKRTNSQLSVYEYYTGAKDRKTIMLPDSSIIMLNENSHLSVSRDFDPHHRQVSIAGEAFFDIQHDADFPFLVNTPQYTIKVLGTTFNVRSYPGRDTTETTLLTGKIEITQGTKVQAPLVLKPNQKFILGTKEDTKANPGGLVLLSKGKVVQPNIDTLTRHLAETSWARKKVEIKDRTFGEIAAQLQSWYGIKIRFADDVVKNYRYTATFDDETIFKALRYLQQSYPFTYSIENDCIVIARN